MENAYLVPIRRSLSAGIRNYSFRFLSAFAGPPWRSPPPLGFAGAPAPLPPTFLFVSGLLFDSLAHYLLTLYGSFFPIHPAPALRLTHSRLCAGAAGEKPQGYGRSCGARRVAESDAGRRRPSKRSVRDRRTRNERSGSALSARPQGLSRSAISIHPLQSFVHGVGERRRRRPRAGSLCYG